MSLDIHIYCTHCDHDVYDANITHNLTRMADAAGLYGPVWRPEENGITTAADLIPLLSDGIARMVADPAKYREYNPSNGWGSYEGFVRWLRDLLVACREHPKLSVRASR